MTVASRPALADRAHACLVGGALGDALGYPIEFLRVGEIADRFGTEVPEALVVDNTGWALVSDDTQMTLFSAEALVDAGAAALADRGLATRHCLTAYQRWLATQTHAAASWSGARGALALLDEPRLNVTREPGMTCLEALSAVDAAGPPPSIENPPNHSKGCGAIMRAAPFGLAPLSREQAFYLARDAGVLTHGHPAGYLPGAAFASLIWGLSRGETLEEAITHTRSLLMAEPNNTETLASIDEAEALAKTGTPSARALGHFGDRADASGRRTRGGGWTGDAALGIAILVARTTDRDPDGRPAGPAAFAESLWRAAAHDGDSDSTAALTGQLLGAEMSPSDLPERWLATLEYRALLARAAAQIVAL